MSALLSWRAAPWRGGDFDVEMGNLGQNSCGPCMHVSYVSHAVDNSNFGLTVDGSRQLAIRLLAIGIFALYLIQLRPVTLGYNQVSKLTDGHM